MRRNATVNGRVVHDDMSEEKVFRGTDDIRLVGATKMTNMIGHGIERIREIGMQGRTRTGNTVIDREGIHQDGMSWIIQRSLQPRRDAVLMTCGLVIVRYVAIFDTANHSAHAKMLWTMVKRKMAK